MQGPLNGWHTVFDATTGLYRLAELKDGVVQRWGSFPPASKPATPRAAPPKPEPPAVQNYGVSLDELRKQAPVGWSNSKGEHIESPAGPTIGAGKALGQQVAWPSIDSARGVSLEGYIAPGIVILAALWVALHPHKGKR